MLAALGASLPLSRGVLQAQHDIQVSHPHDRTLIIVFAGHLKAAADEWSNYRSSDPGGGWITILHAIPPTEDAASQRASIQQFIRQTVLARSRVEASVQAQNRVEFAVLLLGDADSNGIAAWRFPQIDPVLKSGAPAGDEFISDHPYQLMDDTDDSPDIALGRVPAQTPDEARMILSKIKNYEAAPRPGAALPAGRNRVVYVAGEGHFGVMDSILESLFKSMVDRMVPESFDLSMTYAKATSIYCPPPSKVSDCILDRMNEGAVLFNYIGHGHATGCDSLFWNNRRYPILRVPDLDRLSFQKEPTRQAPIAILSCCSTGWYDLPKGAHSLAEAMLFAHGADGEPGGPVAVIAGSRMTHPYANTILQMNLTKALFVDRTPTVGMLDLMADEAMVRGGTEADRELDSIALPIAIAGKWKTSLPGLRRMHAKLYNLLGDPATRIALPAEAIDDFMITDDHITGHVRNMKSGRITITAETERTSLAHPERLQAVIDIDDKDLESKATNNYAVANDRVLARFEGEVKDGRFYIALRVALPSATVVLRGYAAGIDAAGQLTDAIGARRHLPTTSPTSQPATTSLH